MKNLDYFKIFESNSELEDVKDIFLELIDDGYNVEFSKASSDRNMYHKIEKLPKSFASSIQIVINAGEHFKISDDIIVPLLRLKDYSENNYVYNVAIHYKSGQWKRSYLSIDELINIKFPINRIYIGLYKPSDTYHVIWSNKERGIHHSWGNLKLDITEKEANTYLEIMSLLPKKNKKLIFKVVSDRDYWIKSSLKPPVEITG